LLEKFKIRKVMILYVFSVLMDEISTLTFIKTGGIEVNPFVALMVGISPWVWLLYDLSLFLAAYTFDVQVRDKWDPKILTTAWMFFCVYRLSCCIWNYNQIRVHFLT